jgi:hypothetical protein
MGGGSTVRAKKNVTCQTLSAKDGGPFSKRRTTRKSATYGSLLQRLLRKTLLGFFFDNRWESADKPGSVVGNHSSGMHVTVHLKQPTRKHALAARCGLRRLLPYLALLQAGFAVPSPLPSTRCALTAPFQPCRRACARLGGVFSVALSVGSRPPGVTWRRAMWSPDFPPFPCENGDCLADSRNQHRGSGAGAQAGSSGALRASSSARS